MGELWKAFVASLVYLLTPKPPLTPGKCECGHRRCDHKEGKRNCTVSTNPGYVCACEIYIPKKDDSADDGLTPSPADLERLYFK